MAIPNAPALNFKNVQGDILFKGLPKSNETFFFFTIATGQTKNFCKSLATLVPQIATADSVKTQRSEFADATDKIPIANVNIAFSMLGLQQMSKVSPGITLKTGDGAFEEGMKKGAVSILGDPVSSGSQSGSPAWEAPFLKPIHGVILVAGSDAKTVSTKLQKVQKIFSFPGKQSMITEVLTISGDVRPGNQKGHEHFGFMDGTSQPAVSGVDDKDAPPGQDIIQPGIILCGRTGDQNSRTRPTWMLDGSFMAFRKLQQNVREWNKFLVDSSNILGTFSGQLGARLIGRWPSGCPAVLSPDFDNTSIGGDANQNNKFAFPSPQSPDKNFLCPMGAHIRKMNPRDDLGRSTVNNFRVLRRGIPFGPELSDTDKTQDSAQRGLLFACYQSNIRGVPFQFAGFEFLQRNWANNKDFFTSDAGVDAVFGQTNDPSNNGQVGMAGLFPQDPARILQLSGINRFVVPMGGEYFFSPSIPALKNTLAAVAPGHDEL